MSSKQIPSIAVDAREHRIEDAYDRRYVDELYIDESGSVIRRRDTDGYFFHDSNGYVCRCGDEFDTEQEAKTHLRKMAKRANRFPATAPPQTFSFEGSSVTMFDGMVEATTTKCRTAARVESGREYLIATARRSFRAPEDHEFESWGPLQSPDGHAPNGGALWNPYWECPVFKPGTLKRAVATVTGGAISYDPENVRIHTDGRSPALIESGNHAVVIAPLTRR